MSGRRVNYSDRLKLRYNGDPSIEHSDGFVYVFAALPLHGEARTDLPVWRRLRTTQSAACIEVVETTASKVCLKRTTGTSWVDLGDVGALRVALSSGTRVYLDVTALPYHIWAPLLRAAVAQFPEVWAVYAEPIVYQRHQRPTDLMQFDLTKEFGGLAPLPGFSRLREEGAVKKEVFVAFLGFEGTRPAFLANTLDPVPRIIPIVGQPGFRAEYPQVTVASNQSFLESVRGYAEIRFANAACPFDAYDTIESIKEDYGPDYIYLAPVGTRPHAVGAVCYALSHPTDTELMYDHPIRSAGRTSGVGVVHMYRLKPSRAIRS